MIALRSGSGRPPPGSAWLVIVPTTPLLHLPLPVRRDTAPNCEAGASPHIPTGCVVVLLNTIPRDGNLVHIEGGHHGYRIHHHLDRPRDHTEPFPPFRGRHRRAGRDRRQRRG